MKKILVTGVGGPTPRSFVRAIKYYGDQGSNQFSFVGVDSNPIAYGLYDKSLFDSCYLVPRANTNDYWDVINNVLEKECIDAAIVLPEVEVLEWAKNSRVKLTKEIKTHLPNYDLAVTLVNKHRLHKILGESEWVPRFCRVDPGNYRYADISALLGKEFWIRSTEGSSGLGSLKIESESALTQWISINDGVKEFIATEYLPGRNLACKMLYFNGKPARTASAERVEYIMAKVAPSGITGNTSFGRLVNEPQLVKLSENTLKYIAGEIGSILNGIFTVDFKEDRNGLPKITEINIRHVAFTSSIAAGGANLPMDTLNYLFDSLRSEHRIDYQYSDKLIFLRDVDSMPVVIPEKNLFS